MSLYSLGLSGLNAAQAGLTTTGHNIDNAATEGYTRQRVLTSTAGATATSAGFYGRGVQVDTVQRQYDSFLYKQLVGSQSSASSYSTYLDQISQIDNRLGDETVGISPALAEFFASVNAVASGPADAAARADMIGTAQALVSQINSAYQDLQTQREGLNTQIASAVNQVNSYLNQINKLNQEIVIARAQGNGNAPNDLLDQRDQLLSELSQTVGIRYTTQGDMVSISLESGQALLSGTTVYSLQAVASSTDPSRTVVAYNLPSGPGGATTPVQLDDSKFKNGTLGGLMQFRSTALDTLQNRLGQMAVGLAMTFNAVHQQGVDRQGLPGGDFFSMISPAAISGAANAGTGGITADYTDASQITASDYSIKYVQSDPADPTTGQYVVTRLSDNTTNTYTPTGTPPTITFDGLTLNLSGTPADGDTWTLQPTRNAARDLGMAITDPGKIAASSTTNPGTANGDNALALAKLQTTRNLAGNTLSVTDLYAQIVNNVGQQTAAAKANDKAQTAVVNQRLANNSSVSGVNLNEEYVNLSQYQEQYQAAAKIIEVAGTMLDAILGLR
ncbi:flagellar hook-associated protein FlgK [Bordetella genomosp. 9]|uniref:Flagellar hook-associated protein 1 n=1 Tax=Bordetella genomosp. 9 TaxID=1416803 RepID=A0A1W6Z287_9BORD|nr:flagellar hook-associated protein FlgK [Bordetella genomosp. 9]ARP86943.1 flagellar hook-associated protein FlgK [Bordetella genomosp. 9]